MKKVEWYKYVLAALFCVSSVGALAISLHIFAPMLEQTPQQKLAAAREEKEKERAIENFYVQLNVEMFNQSQSNWTMTLTRRPEN